MPVNTERPVDAVMENALFVNIFSSEKGPCREIWTIRMLNWASKSIFVLCFIHYRRVFYVASLLLQACILLCSPVITGMRFVLCSGHYSDAFCVMFRSLQVSILLYFPVITGNQVCVMFRSLQVCVLCYVPVFTGTHFMCSGYYRHTLCVGLLSLCILCCAPVNTGMHFRPSVSICSR